MADFVAVLKKTLDGLNDTSQPMREKVYDRARGTIAAKLVAMNPPLPPAVVDRQKKALEDAIAEIEKGFAKVARSASDPLGELEDVFASLKNPAPMPVYGRATPKLDDGPPPPFPSLPAPRAAIPPASPMPRATSPVVVPAPPSPALTRAAPLAAPAAPGPQTAGGPILNARPVGSQPAAAPVQGSYEVTDGDGFDFERESERFSDAPAQSETIAVDGRRRRGAGRGLAIAAVLLLAVIGGGYGLWIKRDRVEALLAQYGITMPQTAAGDVDTAPAGSDVPAGQPPAADIAAAPNPEPASSAAIPAEPAPAPMESAEAVPEKFTQKLNADGTEMDAGPATAAPVLGEGTSVVAATTPPEPLPQTMAAADAPPAEPAPQNPATPGPDPTGPAATATPPPAATPAPPATATADLPAPASGTPPGPADAAPPPDAAAAQAPPTAPAANAPPAAAVPDPAVPDPATQTAAADPVPAPVTTQSQSIPVGQRAIFYEERTNVSEPSAEPGSIVWSLVQESPGNNLPPEPIIRAEATIPGKDVQLRMTIRRNTDQTLPASHIVEMIFLTPQGFEGGGIDTVLRLSMKNSEQDAGSPLLGIPAKIADGFFLIALNDTKTEIDTNMGLLRNQSWIDVPVQYKNGRRALFTMEKGIPGAKVFDEALKAWQVATASAG